MKNVPFDLLVKAMLIAGKKKVAKPSQFFYELPGYFRTYRSG